MTEIIGALINRIFTAAPLEIAAGLRTGTARLVSRDEAKLMAHYGMGQTWAVRAEYPTLFTLDNNGKIAEATK